MKILLECHLLPFSFLVLCTPPLLAGQKQKGGHDTGPNFTAPSDHSERSRRTLVYTYNSCTGILVALSVPLLITNRNIFMSFNFEANYNNPTDSTDYTQGILKKGDNDQIKDGVAARKLGRSTATSERGSLPPPARRPSFSRKKFYRTIELNLQRYGFAGKRCILRMICELAQVPVHHGNGVFGDLLQLVFTPSMSADESLPGEFYRAEELGRDRGDCSKYRAHCSVNPIDLVSIVLDH